MIKRIAKGALLASLLGLFAVADLSAQQNPTSPPQQVELTDKVLKEFAVAYLELDEVRQEMELELQLVQSAEKAQEIQHEANTKMLAILDEHGFLQEDYAMIVGALNADEEARDRFAAILEELKEEEDTDTGA